MSTWGSREVLGPVLVVPEPVVEVQAGTSIDSGTHRHPLRLGRVRTDVTPEDVPRFGEGARPSAD
ncbi:hypothetical protein ACSNOH_04870 [Streptomyces sp. URMC 127]|uniref:hypothetical protein n=1 Tax=Streptomyces sp. URMC 127 TaxID=3423402 RepID=UPI003F1C0B73